MITDLLEISKYCETANKNPVLSPAFTSLYHAPNVVIVLLLRLVLASVLSLMLFSYGVQE